MEGELLHIGLHIPRHKSFLLYMGHEEGECPISTLWPNYLASLISPPTFHVASGYVLMMIIYMDHNDITILKKERPKG